MRMESSAARVLLGRLALLALLLPSAAMAQPTIPSTPAGEVFGEWLASFNAADAERIARFQETYERETPVADVLDWRRETGGYELVTLEAPSPTSLTATLREVELPDSRIRFQMTVEPGSPARISALDVEQLPTPRLDEAAALAALVARTDALVAQDRFSGAVLVARHGKVLLERAWGQSDRSAGTPNAVDTQFRLGSMNKIITAVAVLQLVEAGKLSLDTPIAAYLPDYPNPEAAAKVTIRHLLTHRAGVGEIGFNDSPEFKSPAEFIARRDAMQAPADYVRQYAGQPLAFEPGSRTEYSSLGFMVLGRLVEQASGMGYYDYVQQHVLDVAGMSRTGSLPETTPVAGRAVGYMRQGEQWVANDDTLPFRGSPAGGGYSTVGDLMRFSQALASGKLLSPAMHAEATRLQSGWQGFGFEVVGEGALANYGHGGMAPGMNAHFRVFPELGYVIVVLSNFDPPAAGLVYSFLHDRMPVAD
jgi:D-alanyl-D-alanine carboxypeptidase